MKRNVILSIALVLLRFIQLLLFVNLVLLMYHWVAQLRSDGPGYMAIEWSLNHDFSRTYQIDLNNRLSAGSFYFGWLQSVISTGLLFFICFQVHQVLRSVRSLKSFIQDNGSRFRRIANIVLLLFLTNMIQVTAYHGSEAAAEITWSFPISYLIFFISAYVLAEIFKEGKRLADDQNLIV